MLVIEKTKMTQKSKKINCPQPHPVHILVNIHPVAPCLWFFINGINLPVLLCSAPPGLALWAHHQSPEASGFISVKWAQY